MNKAELAKAVSEQLGINKKDAESVVDAVFATIGQELVDGKEVNINGFGKLGTKPTSARPGQNPKKLKQLLDQGIPHEEAKTQSAIQIPASRKVTFKPAKALRDAVAQ